MFAAIFGRRKDTPPEETDPIPTHDSPAGASGGEEYIFIERKGPADPRPGGLFPSLAGFMEDPNQPSNPTRMKFSENPVPYLQGVPFKLSAELSAGKAYEELQIELDSILAQISNQAPLLLDYEFSIERSLVG